MHNFTDGIALGAAFASPNGLAKATVTAVLIHEIPHEIGDFTILMESGMTKFQAIKAQFVTAIAAFLGTLVGLFLAQRNEEWESGLLALTSGGFVYIATVGVLPSILRNNRGDECDGDRGSSNSSGSSRDRGSDVCNNDGKGEEMKSGARGKIRDYRYAAMKQVAFEALAFVLGVGLMVAVAILEHQGEHGQEHHSVAQSHSQGHSHGHSHVHEHSHGHGHGHGHGQEHHGHSHKH